MKEKISKGDTKIEYDVIKTFYEDWKYSRVDKLEQEFYEANDFHTSMRGLKIRGVYDTHKEATVRAQVLRRKDPSFNVFAVEIIVDDVLWLGSSKAILNSDNEPAIIKLLTESLNALKVSGLEQAGEEHSPPYDSQVNGSVENALKLVKCRLRTWKLCLEKRIGKRIL